MADLELDPQVLQNTNDAYSSRTDQNDVGLFNEELEKSFEARREEEKERDQKMRSDLFSNKVLVEKKNKKDLEIRKDLFQETYTIAEKRAPEQPGISSRWEIPAFGLMILLFLIFMFQYESYRRKKNKISLENQKLEFQIK